MALPATAGFELGETSRAHSVLLARVSRPFRGFTTDLPEIFFPRRPEDAFAVVRHILGHHMPRGLGQFAGQGLGLLTHLKLTTRRPDNHVSLKRQLTLNALQFLVLATLRWLFTFWGTARKLRLEYAGAIYHVMNRGDRRGAVFKDDKDGERSPETLGETCVKTGWQAHVLRPPTESFHLVGETPQGNLVAGMEWFLGTYTSRLNRLKPE